MAFTMPQPRHISVPKTIAVGGVDEAQWLLDQFEGRSYKVSEFDLRGNPWVMPPEAVVENGLAALEKYYEDIRMAIKQKANVISRRLLKVVLVGSSAVGKTSLMESIASRRPNRTNEAPKEASTVGIEVRPHQLDNTSIEFYDCTGLVDYGGMHQVFLARCALFLLVWDIKRCSGLSVKDLDKVILKMIMRWLYALQLRVPGATVLLVANKCDKVGDDATEITQRVEKRVKIMLKNWEARRGGGHTSHDHEHACRGFHYKAKKNRTEVNLLEGSSIISCDNYVGIPALIERVLQHNASSIVVPPAWELALVVINALRCKRPPVLAALEYLQLPAIKENINVGWSGSFITKGELTSLWRSVVERAKDEMFRNTKDGVSRLRQDVATAAGVSTTGNEAAVIYSDNALEGALWISEFAGQILLVDGERIFLDVAWLSELVTPILSHKLKYLYFPTMSLCTMRDDLVEDKILRWEFARHLWRYVLPQSSQQSDERIANALFSVLIKLGVMLPLGTTMYTTNEESALPSRGGKYQLPTQPPDMLVIMRLRGALREDEQRLLECTLDELGSAAEVSLKWEFDSAGSPYGLVERIIASCHQIGVVERSLCWRYGALFRSHEAIRRSGQNTRLFTMVIRYDATYDTVDGTTTHILTVRMIGPLKSPKVWAALRYVASAVVILSKEWPGVILKGSPVCPKHPTAFPIVYLTTPDKAYVGSPLISEAAPGTWSTGCVCHREVGEVLWLVIIHLGVVVDIKKDPMEALKDYNIRDMFNLWRPYAWQTTIGLCSLALALFGGIAAGVVKGKPPLWQASLTVMILLFMGAAAASVIFYRHLRGVVHGSVKPSAFSSAGDSCDDV